MKRDKIKKNLLGDIYQNLHSVANEAKKRGDLESQLTASYLMIELHSHILENFSSSGNTIGFTSGVLGGKNE